MICGSMAEFKLGGNSKLPPNYAPTTQKASQFFYENPLTR